MIKVTKRVTLFISFARKDKIMIGSIVGAASSLASGIAGGIKARKAARKANAVLDKQAKENEDWFNRRYNEDYTQSAEAQAALTKARELADEQYRKASGTAAS